MIFKIGNVEIKNQVVLAPMAGISNATFIGICADMGVGYAISELISSEAVFRDNKKTMQMLNGLTSLKIPVAIQLFGNNEKVMAASAKKVVELTNAKIIDLNFGCPVPKVAIKGEAGSALLKHPDKVYSLVKSVVEAVDIPVTVKIRAGWDQESINCVEIAKLCEKAGAKAITLHARTRSQGYSGNADWSLIKKVVEAINIPVIGNGDIKTIYDAKRMLDETKCSAIMIGRAALGNPWLIRNIVSYLDKKTILPDATYEERINMMINHLHMLVKEKGETAAVLEIRTHFLYYLKGMPNNSQIKNMICKANSEKEIIDILKGISFD